LTELALKILSDHKALEPIVLEVREHCSFADYFIICSGSSKRQVQALAQHLEEELGKVKIKPLGVEGKEEGLWVLMDYNILVVHIFYQELREFYDLEGLWAEAVKSGSVPPLPATAATVPTPPASNPGSQPESGSHD
jgi:ribosome-associated protein